MTPYQTFLASKRRAFTGDGIDKRVTLPAKLYDWQAAIVRWALHKGRAAIFGDCGTGKSFMQIAWANALKQPVLMFAPLCVAEQTIDEAAKLGVTIRYAHDQHEVKGPLTITNYERLDRFDPARFAGVVLDESSILKSFDGKTRTALIEQWQGAKYRLCCTATPSPNDIAELANHSEFLGLMTRPEFLATWFVHDDEGWRMKGHALQPFYEWLGSWAVAFRSPADLGVRASGFDLPPLEIRDLIVGADGPADGVLFADMGLKGLGGRLKARKVSLQSRAAAVASLVLKSFYDSQAETRVSAEVLQSQQTQGQILRTQVSRETAEVGKTTLRKRSGIPAEGPRRSPRVPNAESAKAQGSSSERTIQDAIGSLPIAAGDTGLSVCDLRILEDGQTQVIPLRGSLSSDEPSEGDSLLELQSRFGQIQRFAIAAAKSSGLPQWVIWCGLNAEQDELAAIFGDLCVSVSGSDSQDSKRRDVKRWVSGEVPILVSKAAIVGWGMNFQNCSRQAFVGLSDSYETYYQCIRRCWRYGQTQPVTATIVVSEAEAGIVTNVRRKEAAALSLASGLSTSTRAAVRPYLEAVA